MTHVLVVEDEPKIAQLLIDYLTSNQYHTSHLNEGSSVVSWIKENQPDAVMLDLTLPGIDGLSLCKEIRHFSSVPIMMITARVEEIDRLLGLEIGADDYICKPFRPREVMARLKAILRRIHMDDSISTKNTALHIDTLTHNIYFHSTRLDLTPVEFRLLQALGEKPGYVYKRQDLVQLIYQDGRVVTARTVDTHIKNIRKKLAQAGGNPEKIFSIYGVVYKWEEKE